jgi:hypothetical protein
MTESDSAPSTFRDSDPTLVDAAALWWAVQHLPTAEPSPAFRQWISVPRKPRVALAIALAIATMLISLLAPVCWAVAGGELKAIERGEVDRAGRSWIVLAHAWGVLVTVVGVTLLALLLVLSAVR